MSDKNYTLLAFFEAKSGKEKALKEMLTKLISPTLQEEGCINYDLYQNLNDATQFMFYENWASKEAHAKHSESPHIKKCGAIIDEFLEKPFEITFWEACTK